MAKRKKIIEKKKPRIISRFFKVARHKAAQSGFDILAICDNFHCSPATIYNHEDERRVLTYDQLKRYVEFYGMPAGVMLMITRLTAELRDGNVDNAERIARGVQAVATHLIENKDALAQRDYRAENGKWQDQTLEEFWDVYEACGLYMPAWSAKEKK